MVFLSITMREQEEKQNIEGILRIRFNAQLPPNKHFTDVFVDDVMDITYRDFLEALLSNLEINTIIRQLESECENLDLQTATFKRSNYLYNRYKFLYGEPELASKREYFKMSYSETIDYLFSPRISLMCLKYIQSNGQIIRPNTQNSGCISIIILFICLTSLIYFIY